MVVRALATEAHVMRTKCVPSTLPSAPGVRGMMAQSDQSVIRNRSRPHAFLPRFVVQSSCLTRGTVDRTFRLVGVAPVPRREDTPWLNESATTVDTRKMCLVGRRAQMGTSSVIPVRSGMFIAPSARRPCDSIAISLPSQIVDDVLLGCAKSYRGAHCASPCGVQPQCSSDQRNL